MTSRVGRDPQGRCERGLEPWSFGGAKRLAEWRSSSRDRARIAGSTSILPSWRQELERLPPAAVLALNLTNLDDLSIRLWWLGRQPRRGDRRARRWPSRSLAARPQPRCAARCTRCRQRLDATTDRRPVRAEAPTKRLLAAAQGRAIRLAGGCDSIALGMCCSTVNVRSGSVERPDAVAFVFACRTIYLVVEATLPFGSLTLASSALICLPMTQRGHEATDPSAIHSS
jgi:hypothetical protein